MPIPLIVYMTEINWRLFYILISIIISFITTFSNKKAILTFFAYPLIKSHQKLIATNVSEVFNSHLFISVNLSALVCFPLVIYHAIAFISNGWHLSEKSTLKKLIIINISNFILGIFFTYFFLLPFTWNFFSEFQIYDTIINLIVKNEIRVSNYVDWVITTLLICSNLTIIPLLLLNYFKKKVSNIFLIYTRKYFLVFNVIIGTLLSPPDIIMQILITSWLMTSYELSILFIISTKLTKSK